MRVPKLTLKQLTILKTIRDKGGYRPPNDQDRTCKKLESMGIIKFREDYSCRVLTEYGIELMKQI